jgi:TRAP-type mannitol/chloroaromatic compound transport system permease small subunit
MRIWDAIWKFQWGLASIGGGICLLLMMLMTVVSVFGRYVLQMDLVPGAFNIIERVLFPLMVFWALPIAHREGIFPQLEAIPAMLSPLWRAVVGLVVLVVEILVYGATLWFLSRFSWGAFVDGRSLQIATFYWPMWPVLIMAPLALVMMLLETGRLVARDVGIVLGKTPPPSPGYGATPHAPDII